MSKLPQGLTNPGANGAVSPLAVAATNDGGPNQLRGRALDTVVDAMANKVMDSVTNSPAQVAPQQSQLAAPAAPPVPTHQVPSAVTPQPFSPVAATPDQAQLPTGQPTQTPAVPPTTTDPLQQLLEKVRAGNTAAAPSAPSTSAPNAPLPVRIEDSAWGSDEVGLRAKQLVSTMKGGKPSHVDLARHAAHQQTYIEELEAAARDKFGFILETGPKFDKARAEAQSREFVKSKYPSVPEAEREELTRMHVADAERQFNAELQTMRQAAQQQYDAYERKLQDRNKRQQAAMDALVNDIAARVEGDELVANCAFAELQKNNKLPIDQALAQGKRVADDMWMLHLERNPSLLVSDPSRVAQLADVIAKDEGLMVTVLRAYMQAQGQAVRPATPTQAASVQPAQRAQEQPAVAAPAPPSQPPAPNQQPVRKGTLIRDLTNAAIQTGMARAFAPEVRNAPAG